MSVVPRLRLSVQAWRDAVLSAAPASFVSDLVEAVLANWEHPSKSVSTLMRPLFEKLLAFQV